MSEFPQIEVYDEFLLNITCQFLQPLNEIINSCDELTMNANRASDNTQKQLSTEIQKRGHHLLDLVRDIRDYADIQTGRMVIERKPTDLEILMKGFLGMTAWVTEKKPQLYIEQDFPASLPHLSSDNIRILQVLLNLLHNAVKFTDSGFIKISLVLHENEVIFQVQDMGIGIAKDKFPLVFAPFQTALSDPADSRIGLGLGLPICKYIVEAHNGNLWFESTENQGSTFYFSIPTQQAG